MAKVGYKLNIKIMEYNLLKDQYDTQVELFINGHIGWVIFTQLEQEYYKRKHLFIINLN